MPTFKPGQRIRVLDTIPSNWRFAPGTEGTVMVFSTLLPNTSDELSYEVELDGVVGRAFLAERHMALI